MKKVYLLHHLRRDDKYDDEVELVGVYRSKAAAKAAITRLANSQD
jgi:hypothetical protein